MILLGLLLPLLSLVVAVLALSAVRRQRGPARSEERLEALEQQVRGLLYRVWMLEQQQVAAPPVEPPAGAADHVPAEPPPPVPSSSEPVLVAEPAHVPVPPAPVASRPSRAAGEDLEQRIGARWATWVGIVAILFGISFFLKWSFESGLLGPGARVVLGLAAGLALALGGLLLHRRRGVLYLSEGLAGLGLGVLYLSLFAAHALYGLIGPTSAFAGMFVVTLLGALVSVMSSRQITAVLTVLGGLLTPVLLAVPEPDERNLLAYLLVLDLLVLGIARFRTWPALDRLAWAGTALLFAAVLSRQPESPHPLSRLALVSALFALFLAVPLLEPLARRRRYGEIDLLLVIANAAGYFWAVYVTLEAWQPLAEGPCALGLAILYRLVSTDYAARVPDDEATVVVHEGVAWTFLTLAIPLALSGRWVTLAWAAQGSALLWSASRVRSPVAAWGGLAALGLAVVRVVMVDRHAPGTVPVWNLTYLVHLLVVVALSWGGLLASGARPERLRRLTPLVLRTVLWLGAALVLAALLWREPPGLWPATLLTAELVVVAGLARATSAPAWVIATPVLAAVVLARVLVADDAVARIAAGSLLNAPLVSRIAACAALAAAGHWLARSTAPAIGRALSGAAGVVLLFALSVDWTRYQGGGGYRWTTQVGLSVLWTLYAAGALGWGFVRSRPRVRYGALFLFGLTVFKVFVVDLAAVRTAYRILSFLVLGVALLGVSLLYQKARKPVPS